MQVIAYLSGQAAAAAATKNQQLVGIRIWHDLNFTFRDRDINPGNSGEKTGLVQQNSE